MVMLGVGSGRSCGWRSMNAMVVCLTLGIFHLRNALCSHRILKPFFIPAIL